MGKLIGWCTAVALALTETGQAQDHSILSLSPPQSPQLGPATAGDGRGCQHAKLGGSGVPYMRRRPPKSYTRASTGYSASILQDDAQEMHEGPNGEMEWQARPRPVPKMQPSVVQEELEFNEDGEQVWRRTQGAIHVTMTDEELEEVDAEEEFG